MYFWCKKTVHRHLVPRIFLTHCLSEAEKLRERILPQLSEYCDGKENRPRIVTVLNYPMVSHLEDKSLPSKRSLFDAHCLAITTAIGLNAVDDNIDPRHQRMAFLDNAKWLIAEDDVGKENMGHPPSPPSDPMVRVDYLPGALEGGIKSLQKSITNQYERLPTTKDYLYFLLLSLRVIWPNKDLFSGYAEEITVENFKRSIPPDSDAFHELEKYSFIRVADAELDELPTNFVHSLIKALEDVDPFWPKFSSKHRLIWSDSWWNNLTDR